MTIQEIDAKKNLLAEKVMQMANVHKQKFGNIDISEPKSEDEKQSECEMSAVWSEINELIRMKNIMNRANKNTNQ